jgi:hypothetical protein
MLNSYASGNSGTRRSSQSCAMVVFKLLWDLCFPDLHFVKICPQKANGAQNQGTSELLNWSDRVKIWDLVEGHVSLVRVGWWCGKNEQHAQYSCAHCLTWACVASAQVSPPGNHRPQIPRSTV